MWNYWEYKITNMIFSNASEKAAYFLMDKNNLSMFAENYSPKSVHRQLWVSLN